MAWDGLPSSRSEFLLPPSPRFWICYFAFAATFKERGLSIIELSYLVKPSCFNMSMSVKTIGCLSNKMFLMIMHVCEETIVTLSGVFFNN